MARWKNIKKKLDSLDEKVFSSRMMGRWGVRIGLGVLAAALVTTSALRYDSWRKEPIHRDDAHVVAPRYFDLDSANEANRLLLDFPTEIPGAANVDRYITPGAKYCLVHIRQKHLVENIFDELKEEVAVIQADIYQILDYLARNRGLNGVYTEAVSAWSEDLHNTGAELSRTLNQIHTSEEAQVRQGISELEERIQSLTEGKRIPWEAFDKYPNDKEAVDKYISDLQKELQETKAKLPRAIEQDREYEQKRKEENRYDGVDKAAVEHGIKILAAEDVYANMRASLAVKHLRNDNKDLKLHEMVLDDREDILLQYIASQNEPLAVCVYGGAHAWGGRQSFGTPYSTDGKVSLRDNIATWNRENSDKKFSLIEITPTNYDKPSPIK